MPSFSRLGKFSLTFVPQKFLKIVPYISRRQEKLSISVPLSWYAQFGVYLNVKQSNRRFIMDKEMYLSCNIVFTDEQLSCIPEFLKCRLYSRHLRKLWFSLTGNCDSWYNESLVEMLTFQLKPYGYICYHAGTHNSKYEGETVLWYRLKKCKKTKK